MTGICKCGDHKFHHPTPFGCKKFEAQEFNRRWEDKEQEEAIKAAKNSPYKVEQRIKPQNHNEYVREWNKKNSDKVRKILKKYRSKNKEKQLAWDKARRGIGAIKIEGLCQICKVEEAKLRHHEDYSKPREVILICAKCHKNIHSNSQQGSISEAKSSNISSLKPVDTNSQRVQNPIIRRSHSSFKERRTKPADTFNLSEKVLNGLRGNPKEFNYYKEKDVREFIKRLKEDERPMKYTLNEWIDKLAGEKLT